MSLGMCSLVELWASPTCSKITATLEYLKRQPKYKTEKPYILALDISLEDEASRSNLDFEQVEVPVANLRSHQHLISLPHHGFECLKIPLEDMNKWFRHLNPLKESEGVQEILSTHLGAEKVIVFDHAVRAHKPTLVPSQPRCLTT